MGKLFLMASRALSWLRDKYADDEETRLWEAHNASEAEYEARMRVEIEQWRGRLKRAGIKYDA